MKYKLFLAFFSFFCLTSDCFADKSVKVQDIINYLNGFTTMQSDFKQFDGSTVSVGSLLISKPRHARWEYYSPNQIIVNTSSVFTTYYDKDLDQSSSFLTNSNIMKFLYDNVQDIENGIFFYKDGKAFLKVDEDEVSATFRFAINPIKLEGVDIINKESTEHAISIAFSNIKYNIPIKASIFSDFH